MRRGRNVKIFLLYANILCLAKCVYFIFWAFVVVHFSTLLIINVFQHYYIYNNL